MHYKVTPQDGTTRKGVFVTGKVSSGLISYMHSRWAVGYLLEKSKDKSGHNSIHHGSFYSYHCLFISSYEKTTNC